mmetsp:Transcript_84149/g.252355  ORF Transcript_84149/g.252355 Transcript_84149/m.252355 type:complete len:382 (-) Transcript_84149:601-1746(-)
MRAASTYRRTHTQAHSPHHQAPARNPPHGNIAPSTSIPPPKLPSWCSPARARKRTETKTAAPPRLSEDVVRGERGVELGRELAHEDGGVVVLQLLELGLELVVDDEELGRLVLHVEVGERVEQRLAHDGVGVLQPRHERIDKGRVAEGVVDLAECAVDDERGEDDLVKGAEHLGEALVVGSLHHDLQLLDATRARHELGDVGGLLCEPDEQRVEGRLLPVGRREKAEVEGDALVLLELGARALGGLGDVAHDGQRKLAEGRALTNDLLQDGQRAVDGGRLLTRAVDTAEQVERIDALVAHLRIECAAALEPQQRDEVRDGLGALQLVHVGGLAHAEVLDRAQHLEDEPRRKLVGAREHLHQARQDLARRHARLDLRVGERE